MIKVSKKRKTKISQRITLMFVPSNSQKIIKLSFSQWTSYAVGFFFICLLISLGGSILLSLSQQKKIGMYANQIQAQQEEISTLLENNGEYLSEISQLQSKTREIKNELNSIENFKSLIYEKINNSTFPNPSPKNSPISFNVSSIDLEMPKGGGDNLNFNEMAHELNSIVDSSNTQIKNEFKSLKDLNKKIDALIPYLEAYPSIFPVQGRVTSEMGWRKNPFNRRADEFHSGIDFAADIGTDVIATGKGIVTFSGYNKGYGYLVTIDHGFGIETRYAHNSSLLVTEGEWVNRGDIIAKSGNTGNSTGPHVHYEVLLHNEPQNPRDFVID